MQVWPDLPGPRSALGALARWPVASQQHSRRNAMVASTALAQLRAERQDVEDYLATRAADVDTRFLARAARA